MHIKAECVACSLLLVIGILVRLWLHLCSKRVRSLGIMSKEAILDTSVSLRRRVWIPVWLLTCRAWVSLASFWVMSCGDFVSSSSTLASRFLSLASWLWAFAVYSISLNVTIMYWCTYEWWWRYLPAAPPASGPWPLVAVSALARSEMVFSVDMLALDWMTLLIWLILMDCERWKRSAEDRREYIFAIWSHTRSQARTVYLMIYRTYHS